MKYPDCHYKTYLIFKGDREEEPFESDTHTLSLLHFDNNYKPYADEVETNKWKTDENYCYYHGQLLACTNIDFDLSKDWEVVFDFMLLSHHSLEWNNIFAFGHHIIQSGSDIKNNVISFINTDAAFSWGNEDIKNAWHSYRIVHTGSTNKTQVYVDNVLKTDAVVPSIPSSANGFYFGGSGTNYQLEFLLKNLTMSIYKTGASTPSTAIYFKNKADNINYGNGIDIDYFTTTEFVNIKNAVPRLVSSPIKLNPFSVYFDGYSSMYLNIDSKFDFSTGKDFTIDWWEYKLSSDPCQAVCTIGPPDAITEEASMILSYNSSDSIPVNETHINDNVVIQQSGSVIINKWVHRAIIRNGSRLLFAENGKINYTCPAVNPKYKSSYQIILGKYNGKYFKGYLSEFRISDIARWTTDFKPPKEAYNPFNKHGKENISDLINSGAKNFINFDEFQAQYLLEQEINKWYFMEGNDRVTDYHTKFDFSNGSIIYNRDLNSMRILKDKCYITNILDYDFKDTKEFTLSFYFRILRSTLLDLAFYKTTNVIHGITWNDKNTILLYDTKYPTRPEYFNNKCISVKYNGVLYRIFFDFERHNEISFIHFVLCVDPTNVLRIFVNGVMYFNCKIQNPDYEFKNIKIGNYKTDFTVPDIMEEGPMVEFDEIAICDTCNFFRDFKELEYATNEKYPERGVFEDDRPETKEEDRYKDDLPDYFPRSSNIYERDTEHIYTA